MLTLQQLGANGMQRDAREWNIHSGEQNGPKSGSGDMNADPVSSAARNDAGKLTRAGDSASDQRCRRQPSLRREALYDSRRRSSLRRGGERM
jgi:hypothetical protein